jgi:hypothetical protein
MERDGVLAHGMSYFLNESFLVRGDEYYMAVCNKTGEIAIYNEAKNLFISPYADGPINFVTNPDGTMNIKNLTRFGRSFSILRIPYSLKLLIQELLVLNVQMRIITEDNIDQLLSMSFSDNIGHLLQVKAETNEELKKAIDDYATNIRQIISNEKRKTNVLPETPLIPEPVLLSDPVEDSPAPAYNSSPDGSPVYNPDGSQVNPDGSPVYNPDGSPVYIPDGSPVYNPDGSPVNPDSPPIYISNGSNNDNLIPYADGSPAYNPDNPILPQYSPHSPSQSPPQLSLKQLSPQQLPQTPAQNILEVEQPEAEPEKNSENENQPSDVSDRKVVIETPVSNTSTSSSSSTKKITL